MSALYDHQAPTGDMDLCRDLRADGVLYQAVDAIDRFRRLIAIGRPVTMAHKDRLRVIRDTADRLMEQDHGKS